MLDFLSKGKMEIKLDKMSFAQGESISGTVSMQLKNPAKARGVNIKLIGERKITHFTGKGTSTTIERVYNFNLQLDGEKEYTTQPYEYKFELKAPQQNQPQAPEGVMGGVAKAAAFLTTGASGPISWYLVANLDIPKGFDLSKKVQINVG